MTDSNQKFASGWEIGARSCQIKRHRHAGLCRWHVDIYSLLRYAEGCVFLWAIGGLGMATREEHKLLGKTLYAKWKAFNKRA